MLPCDVSATAQARCISVIIMITIFVTIIAFVVETLPAVHKTNVNLFSNIEHVSVIVFTSEFAARLWSSESRSKFMRHPLNIIDLISIMPFYLEVCLKRFDFYVGVLIRYLALCISFPIRTCIVPRCQYLR